MANQLKKSLFGLIIVSSFAFVSAFGLGMIPQHKVQVAGIPTGNSVTQVAGIPTGNSVIKVAGIPTGNSPIQSNYV